MAKRKEKIAPAEIETVGQKQCCCLTYIYLGWRIRKSLTVHYILLPADVWGKHTNKHHFEFPKIKLGKTNENEMKREQRVTCAGTKRVCRVRLKVKEIQSHKSWRTHTMTMDFKLFLYCGPPLYVITTKAGALIYSTKNKTKNDRAE